MGPDRWPVPCRTVVQIGASFAVEIVQSFNEAAVLSTRTQLGVGVD